MHAFSLFKSCTGYFFYSPVTPSLSKLNCLNSKPLSAHIRGTQGWREVTGMAMAREQRAGRTQRLRYRQAGGSRDLSR